MAAVRRIVVIGGGIVGLATARELSRRGDEVVVLEKEGRWAAHQTGHNSNVVHAGLYYRPGSLKARMSVAGNASIVAYAREHGVPVEVCGKLVVATSEEEVPRLRALAERASRNGVPARMVSVAEAREHEPEVSCVAALRVESTGIIDFPAVCAAMVRELTAAGADLRTNSPALAIRTRAGRVEVATPSGVVRGDALVNCAGLHSDRVARMAGLEPEARIVPFRGEYYELRPERRSLVRGLIYPVPDPTLPFLGVHLTRMLDGSVHAGPNAVLALSREGYRWGDVSAGDVAEVLRFPGTWRLARKYAYPTGLAEVLRSLSKRRFAESLARLVPAVGEADLVRAEAGVRAQAMRRDGSLVDDFLVQEAPGQVHVLNAPSPAATGSLEIGAHVAGLVR
ncbi:FAD dependent oxidoreductase [Actinosynnema mirum DSM 43827]|uniref:FAD dependent oxidoreductase n=1 Tax=Actinosynnema mirum (strain ATCC 29888 / DSM 43827 / JCM 3225 / NBRC 14064 / NCIMB 13271 / NRRL B-12336 / IMRU 3971 / 101) TaxID=446462 RepID=C6WDU5_ACTMD|nr:FAD dependent oxidoreductase [Actinosynnema mirum DSM 43827]AXX27487.1 L-2-hydroxyglutarate oxidase [Actinosynnema pretiosum subsp. pretiosum]